MTEGTDGDDREHRREKRHRENDTPRRAELHGVTKLFFTSCFSVGVTGPE